MQSFNTEADKIDESIPPLLEGLKLAFFSSVLGLAMQYYSELETFSGKRKTLKVTVLDLIEELKNINAGTIAVKDALVGEGDSSLSTQLMKLRTDFAILLKR